MGEDSGAASAARIRSAALAVAVWQCRGHGLAAAEDAGPERPPLGAAALPAADLEFLRAWPAMIVGIAGAPG